MGASRATDADTTDKDPSDAFWTDEAPTTAARPAAPPSPGEVYPTNPWVAPAQQRPGGTSWPVAVGAAVSVALLVLALGGGALWFFSSGDDAAQVTSDSTTSEPATTEPAPTETSTTTAPAPPTTTVTSTTTSTGAVPPRSTADVVGDPFGTPEEQLQNYRDSSYASLYLDGRWGIVLSSKYDGIYDKYYRTEEGHGSHTWRTPDILDLHEELIGRHAHDGPVHLLTSEDLQDQSQRSWDDTMWITILDPEDELLLSKEDAQDWCDRHMADYDDAERAWRCGTVHLVGS